MAYNSYFPNNNYQQPYYPQYQQTAPQMQQGNGIIWVSGIEGAKSYMVGAGRSVLLMDSEANVFYLKSTDMSGMPQPLRVFDYTERTAQSQSNQIIDVQPKEIDTSMFVTREELEERLAKLATARTTTKAATTAKG